MTAWLVTHPSGVRYRVEAGRLESTLLNLRADGNDEFMVEAAPELLPVPELERADETFPAEWTS